MKYLFTVGVLSFLIISCTKEIDTRIEGNYEGSFYRIHDSTGAPETSFVQISFTMQDFSGTSVIPSYPEIGEGKYAVNKNEINIENTGAYTTGDQSLIFDGKYNYELNGNKLKIWKTYPFLNKKDVYILQRIP